MTDKEIIKAELLRRVALYKECNQIKRLDECHQILSFIDSMQEESASEDLEED